VCSDRNELNQTGRYNLGRFDGEELEVEKDPSKESSDEVVHDWLSAFNAEEIVDDPDDLKPKKPNPLPAATPDSPNPI
jgi:hypothetical protein